MTNTALITGASSGIGYELAKVFAEKGHDLVLVARTKSKLDKLAKELKETHGIKVKVLPKDLNLENAPQEIFDTLKKAKVDVDFLVNNAGLGISRYFYEMEDEMIQNEWMRQVCILGGGKGKITKVFFLRGLTKLAHYQEIKQFMEEHQLTEEQVRQLFQQIE